MLKDSKGAVVVGGDLLFRGSVGRTDFFNSSVDDLLASIRRLYEELEDESIILSGHTTPTFLETERDSNPFVVGSALIILDVFMMNDRWHLLRSVSINCLARLLRDDLIKFFEQ